MTSLSRQFGWFASLGILLGTLELVSPPEASVRDGDESVSAPVLPAKLPQAERAEPPPERSIPDGDGRTPALEPLPKKQLPIERLLRPPERLSRDRDALRAPPATPPADPSAKASSPPGGIDPSLAVKSERSDSPIPGVKQDSKEVRAGVTVSPGEGSDSQGKVSITVEGAVRQDEYESEAAPARRDESVGVRVTVPWPTEKRKTDKER